MFIVTNKKKGKKYRTPINWITVITFYRIMVHLGFLLKFPFFYIRERNASTEKNMHNYVTYTIL